MAIWFVFWVFSEGKAPFYLCLGFIWGLAPQGVFLSGAPLPALQGETTQQSGGEPQLGSAQQNINLIRRWGLSRTNPISYSSQKSCSVLQNPSVQQLCGMEYLVKIPRCSVGWMLCCLYQPTGASESHRLVLCSAVGSVLGSPHSFCVEIPWVLVSLPVLVAPRVSSLGLCLALSFTPGESGELCKKILGKMFSSGYLSSIPGCQGIRMDQGVVQYTSDRSCS